MKLRSIMKRASQTVRLRAVCERANNKRFQRKRAITLACGIVAAIFLMMFGISVQSKIGPSFHVVKTIHLPGNRYWDLMAADSAGRRLYVTHDTVVHVINMDTDRLIGDVKGVEHVHGVALAPDLKRGYVTNGKRGTVTCFAIDTLKNIAEIKTGDGPDAITYDPMLHRVFVMNGEGESITVIDPKTNTVTGTIPLGTGPESAVTDGKGTLYVNLEKKQQVAVIDENKMAVTAHWSTTPGDTPTGLAIDPAHHLLFVGCRNKMLVMLNTVDGSRISTLPIGDRVDTTVFDPRTNLIYDSNGDGTLTITHEESATKFTNVATVLTQVGAKTIALDLNTGNAYLSTAKFVPGPRIPHQRPEIVPGTFVVLKVAHG